ncbi:MAG: AMP-binding protein [Anaeromyxobacter sp.]|nr:AMP-binding protein [Anaeromyxobacter sp.]
MIPRLPVFRFPDRTLPAQLCRTAARVPERRFLAFFDPAAPADAPPREVSYGAFLTLVRRAAAFLRAAEVGPGDRVLLLAENSPEWPAFALAAMALRAEPAALFSSLAAGPAEEIARRVRPKAIFVSGLAQWRKLAPATAELTEAGLRAVLSLEPLAPDEVPPGLLLAFGDRALGAAAEALPVEELTRLAAAVGQEDPFLLLFTSGTTGRQKGVRLCQRSIVHAVDCGAAGVKTTENDLGLALLPFGHVAGHDQFFLAMAQGHGLAMIARKEDVPRALALGCTYVFSVPLVYERMRAQALAKVAALPGPVRSLVEASLRAAARVRVDGGGGALDRLLTGVADATVGKKLRAALGGRVRGVFSGGAPASGALFRFFEGLGLPFVELYGMTETAGLVSMNPFDGPRRAGSVGLTTPDHEVRVSDEGELQVRGPLLLTGYLEPSDGEGAFTPDGYYRTGDLARLDPDGALWITGRKKNLMVLSTGKKIAPEPIETAVASTAPFEGAVLLGEGRPFVALAVFVAQPELDRLAAAGLEPAEALLPQARAALGAFSDHELPKKLLVIPGTPQDHPTLITPTLKLKRDAVAAYLGARVAALFTR